MWPIYIYRTMCMALYSIKQNRGRAEPLWSQCHLLCDRLAIRLLGTFMRFYFVLTISFFVIHFNLFTSYTYKVPFYIQMQYSRWQEGLLLFRLWQQIQTWHITTGERLEVWNCPVKPVISQQVGGLIFKCI